MSPDDDTPDGSAPVEAVLATPDLAGALESDQFRRFLDHVPIAVVVSDLRAGDRIVYANLEFEAVSGQKPAELVGKPWSALPGRSEDDGEPSLAAAVTDDGDYVGTFRIHRSDADAVLVDAYSNVIEDDGGTPAFRLVALVDIGPLDEAHREEFERRIREKDTLLREIQHRVKNNLQMITALIRLEARNMPGGTPDARFDRLAGRIDALKLLYSSLSEEAIGDEIDLGVYLSQIAAAVMRTHGVEGIRLDLKVDIFPVSVNVAMPAGLVINELLTNALKHAFEGREGGTITLHSLTDETGCTVTVADNGNGLPDGVTWPKPGKLGSLIVQSLRENAKARVDVQSSPGEGTRVTIVFSRKAAAPEAATHAAGPAPPAP